MKKKTLVSFLGTILVWTIVMTCLLASGCGTSPPVAPPDEETPQQGIPVEEAAPSDAEKPQQEIPAKEAPAPEVVPNIQMKVTSQTWREGSEPFNIYDVFEGKLESAGIEVVREEAAVYNGVLVVDYEERKSSEYESKKQVGVIEKPIVGYGTYIRCELELRDRQNNLLWQGSIVASTPDKVEVSLTDVTDSLYRAALERFKIQVYYIYLGEFVAAQYGIGDEVPLWVTALENAEFYTRLSAVEALGKRGDAIAVEPLIKALSDENQMIQNEAAEALGEIGDTRAVEPLIQALTSGDITTSAAEALGGIGDVRAVEPLIETLNHENKWVRGHAAKSLGQIGDTMAVDPLIRLLKDEHGFGRSSAAQALGEIGDARAVDPLIQLLKDEDGFVRCYAVQALGEIGDARAVDPLIQALSDWDYYEVRASAAEALGKIGDTKALDPLTHALSDVDYVVREAAQEALDKLK